MLRWMREGESGFNESGRPSESKEGSEGGRRKEGRTSVRFCSSNNETTNCTSDYENPSRPQQRDIFLLTTTTTAEVKLPDSAFDATFR